MAFSLFSIVSLINEHFPMLGRQDLELLIVSMNPFASFLLSFGIFYFAIQRQRGYMRHLLIIGHSLSLLACLRAEALQSLPIPPRVWVQFVLWATLHTSSVLILEQRLLVLRHMPPIQRLKIVARTWVNIRRAPLREEIGTISYKNLAFILEKAKQIFLLLITQKIISFLSFHAFVNLGIHFSDFESVKQGIIPPVNKTDLCLRAVLSLNWIWDTYFVLNTCHHFLALIFVAILRWDLPDEWPPLFGSVAEAYSLLRFWGIFWQRLHLVPFEAFMPQFLASSLQQAPERRRKLPGAGGKALRALWIFMVSGLFHVMVNWIILGQGGVIPELRFFLSNFSICLMEKLVSTRLPRTPTTTYLKFLGYIWVVTVFFCLVPSWRYPLILAQLLQ
ncbi:hypothetical protein F4825DRAFT_448419 [Nemania diffusa]|nr:hypothetical protein F4825DRAFT_448419 [Nemania diffusa]